MSKLAKLAEITMYGTLGVIIGYAYRGRETRPDWTRPNGWVGYYPSSSGEALAHPCRAPECDANHKFPCPKRECRGYQGSVAPVE